MAVTYRSTGGTQSNSSSSLTLTEPSGASSGDFLLGYVIGDDIAGGDTLTAPGGWTVLDHGTFINGSSQRTSWNLSYVIRGGSAPSLVWTGGGTGYNEGQIFCFTGTPTLTKDSFTAGTGADMTQPDPPSTTAVATTSLAVAGCHSYGGSAAGGWTAPTGYTSRGDNVSGEIGLASKALSAAGAENPGVFTNDNGNFPGWAFTLTITDGGGGGGGRTTKNTRANPLGERAGMGWRL